MASSIKRIIDSESYESWSKLYSKLILNAIKTSDVISAEVYEFLHSSASASGTNVGYVLCAMLTTLNFILSKNKSCIEIRDGFKINLNTLFIFVGQPSTGN